uniref:Uncharacterized protein n=1 Tax=Rhizophora mucronata TaxID=61149 RepID=A0A2P2KPZ2_RHIMU
MWGCKEVVTEFPISCAIELWLSVHLSLRSGFHWLVSPQCQVWLACHYSLFLNSQQRFLCCGFEIRPSHQDACFPQCLNQQCQQSVDPHPCHPSSSLRRRESN